MIKNAVLFFLEFLMIFSLLVLGTYGYLASQQGGIQIEYASHRSP